MSIYGFNSDVRDVWSTPSSNVFKIDSLTSDEWVKAVPGRQFKSPDGTGFWDIRDKTVADNVQKIWSQSGPAQFPLDGRLKMIQTANPESFEQVINAMPQWKKLNDIIADRGIAIGFDIETIGSVNGPFAITEFGIGSRGYSQGKVSVRDYSLALGIQPLSEEFNYANDVINRFSRQGWNSLSDIDKVTAERLSMYGQKAYHDIFAMQQIDLISNKEKFLTVVGLDNPIRDVEAMRKGLSNLTTAYKETDSKYVLKRAIDVLDSRHNNGVPKIVFGANSEFDIVGIKHVADKLGIAFNADGLSNDVVDVVYAARAQAAVTGQSVESFHENMFDIRTGASVQEQINVHGIDAIQTHHGGGDVSNEGSVITSRSVKDAQSYIERVIETVDPEKLSVTNPNIVREYGEDTYFLIQRGATFDKNKLDSASIHGETTQNFSVSNQFWEIDSANSGYRIIDDQERYILAMVNPLDKDVKFAIEKETEEEAVKFLRNNTAWFDKSNMPKSRLELQETMKYYDEGRRSFAKFFEPAAVGVSGKEEVFGMSELRKYLDFNDGFNNWLKEQGKTLSVDKFNITMINQDSVQILNDYISQVKPDNVPVSSFYQKQAYLGMRTKLTSESSLLRSIVDKTLDATNGNNLTATIIAKKAYEDSIQEIMQAHGGPVRKNAPIVASDVFGIDVLMPDDSIKRIDAQRVQSATQSMNRIFKNFTTEQFSTTLDNFADRGLLTEQEVSKYISQYSSTKSNYGLFTDLAYRLNSHVDMYNDIKNPIKAFQEAMQNPLTPETNLEMIFREARDITQTRFRFAGDRRKFITINDMYDSSVDSVYSGMKSKVASAIDRRIQAMPNVQFIDAFRDEKSLNAMLSTMAENLNIPTDADGELKLLNDMFNATDYKTKQFKRYAINGRYEEGIRSFIVSAPEGSKKSSFMLMTNTDNMNRLVEGLVNDEYDFENLKKLTDSVGDRAAVYEIPHVNVYNLADATDAEKAIIKSDKFAMTTINQSHLFEKFLMPKLDVHIGTSGKVESYLNNGIYDFMSAYRQVGATALDYVKEGRFSDASRVFRKMQNEKFKDMPATSSYRTRLVTRNGETFMERVTNFGNSDFLRGYEIDIEDSLKKLFRESVVRGESSEVNLNTAQKVIYAFGNQLGKERGKKSFVDYADSIIKSNEFSEFFTKRILHKIGEDGDILNYLKDSNVVQFTAKELDMDLLDMIRSTVALDTDNKVFHQNVLENVDKLIAVKDRINQVLPESAMTKGIWSFIKPGDLNAWSFLDSTMRPVYTQANNGMLFNPDDALNVSSPSPGGLYNRGVHTTDIGLMAKNAMIKEGYDSLGTGSYADQEYMFMAKQKQISDLELQLKYREMAKQTRINQEASRLGIEKDIYSKGLEYMRKDLMSINEGKAFHSPTLGEQKLFTEVDGERIIFDTDSLDTTETRKILESFNGRTIVDGDVIGQTNRGTFIYHEGPSVVLDSKNIEELLDTTRGFTRYEPQSPSIKDVKLVLNGSEKMTSHGIIMKNFMDYTGISDRGKALELAKSLFYDMSDGADIVANLSVVKHANNFQAHSIMNIIETEYIRAGQGQTLANKLEAMRLSSIQQGDGIFAGFGQFGFDATGNKIIISGSPKSPVSAIDTIYQSVLRSANGSDATDVFGDFKIDKDIIEEITKMEKNNISYSTVQRQYQNEHMAKTMSLDQRIEQGIRRRSRGVEDYFTDTPETRTRIEKEHFVSNPHDAKIADGILDGYNGKVLEHKAADGTISLRGYSFDDLYIDDLIQDSKMFNGKMDKFLGGAGSQLSETITVANAYTKATLASKRQNRKQIEVLEKSIRGIFESVRYSIDNTDTSKNVLSIDFDTIKQAAKVKNVSADDLIDILFYTDGRPSEVLKDIAKAQDVKLSYANSMRFSLNGHTLKYRDKTFTDILIPIQNVMSKYDNRLFQEQQLATRELLRDYMKTINNPQELNGASVESALSKIYSTWINRISKQLDTMDKDSDLYKIYNRITLPNSSGYLAQDEVPFLVEEMMDDKFVKQIKKRDALEARLSSGFDSKVAEKLDDVYKDIDDRLYKISKEIRSGDVKKIVSIVGDTGLDEILYPTITDAAGNSKRYYGYAAAMGKQGFKKAGVNFGLSGMEIFSDYEKHLSMSDKEFTEFRKTIVADSDKIYSKISSEDIAKKLNSLGIKGLDIDDTEAIMPQLNEYLKANYMQDAGGISIRDLNNSIKGKNLRRIFDSFDDVAENYLRDVGMFGLVQRYPAFSGQPIAKIIYDSTMNNSGAQMRLLSPLSSAFTHVDFDGDNLFAALRLNGSVMMRANTESYQNTLKAYQRNITHFNETMSELILDPDSIKRDNINAGRYQRGTILETFREKEYKAAIKEFADEHNLVVDEMTKAEKFAAKQSDQVMRAFYNANLNTLTDEQIVIASMTPAKRKINIGSISTPNFTLRNAIEETFKRTDPDITPYARDNMAKWSEALSNMRHKGGGLLTIAEQKGIDVKHVIDAMNVAETVKWSTGMTKLYKYEKITRESNISAISDLMSATRKSLFKEVKDENLLKTVQEIVDTPFETFEKELLRLQAIVDNAATKTAARNELLEKTIPLVRNKMGLRAAIEFQGIKGFSQSYMNSSKLSSFEQDIAKVINEIGDMFGSSSAREQYYGTTMNHILNSISDINSDEHIAYKKGSLYFQIGLPDSKAPGTRAYQYDGDGVFTRFDTSTNTLMDETRKFRGSPSRINKEAGLVFNPNININTQSFASSADAQDLVYSSVAKERMRLLLNHTMLDNNNVRSSLDGNLMNIIKGVSKNGKATRSILYGMFETDYVNSILSSNNKTPEEVLENIQKMSKAFRYSNNTISSGELIRQINKRIAEEYTPGKPVTESYDEIFKREMISGGFFDNEDILNKYIAKSTQLSDFTEQQLDEFNNAKKLLNEDLYDIMEEQKRIEKSFADAQLDLDKFSEKKSGLRSDYTDKFDMTIKPLKDLLEGDTKHQDIIDNLARSNRDAVEKAHSKIYNIFKDTDQMDRFFEWSKVSGDSVVGFGEYTGVKFNRLSVSDIEIIKKNAIRTRNELAAITDAAITSSKEFKLKSYAAEKTLQNLESFTPNQVITSSALNATNKARAVQDLIEKNKMIAGNVLENINELTAKAKYVAKDKTTKKTIGGSILDSVKNINMKSIKGVGIVVGALAALGIANNMLHNQKSDSPLTPARKPNGNGAPDINGEYPDGPQQQQAPASPGKRTIYHDKGSGLDFKVTAKTKSFIDDRNNAKLIGMSGGGSASIYSHADTSGVTDNWLANKFAELT